MIFESYLNDLQSQGQYRQLREVATAHKQSISRDGKTWINFTSNDYLGLGQRHIDVMQLQKRLDKYGAHLASSRLVSGHSKYYVDLEARIRDHYQFDEALLMTSGYDANLAIFQIFKQEKVVVFSDALNCQFWSYMAQILCFKWRKAGRQLYNCLPAFFYNISLIIL
ncbi:aminotransferase class I/II-fold pyridoxal phosphate-dependent enzyme [Staphylococcus hyicus]|uniref:aminotransferase class I/II-fold pyridoxal phosphate-dependent enzyme n=1 Tax=Staphylococcus hyicus TaxID=1284 RepID=UPI0023652D3B|nr:aminotransferase class I/II-fold pyridoxal phosphate-dependent enzyme [Staphylococcus hyicus]